MCYGLCTVIRSPRSHSRWYGELITLGKNNVLDRCRGSATSLTDLGSGSVVVIVICLGALSLAACLTDGHSLVMNQVDDSIERSDFAVPCTRLVIRNDAVSCKGQGV